MADVPESDVLNALRKVYDPDLNRDIVTLGFIKNMKICGGTVGFEIELTTPACPVKEELKKQAQDVVKAVAGVTEVNVTMTAQTRGRPVTAANDMLKNVKNIIAIGSGKGGVGKSTATVNLALALASTGAKVGILDADIYGPSIPGMLGTFERPRATSDNKAIPPIAFGIKVMSVGVLLGDEAPAIWRGPIASRMLQQFLGAVEWGELDYLLLDLPPGTGDVQLTLAQTAPLNGAVVVTTPQDVALRIAKKGLRMFQTVNVPILGLIENMSGYTCPDCGKTHNIFRKGGGERAAREMGIPFLGGVPLDPRMVEAGDLGKPLVALDKTSGGAIAFEAVARNLAAQISIVNYAESNVKVRPKDVQLADAMPRITWDDFVTMKYNPRELRMACPCAACKDEMTGEQILQESDVPLDITISEARPVGRYGLNLIFSDGHGSGIFVFDLLRAKGTPV